MKHTSHSEDQLKQQWLKRRHFSIRINVFFFFTFLLFSILIVRLAFLQFVEGKNYEAAEQYNGSFHSTVSPIRGNIYDIHGAPIAYTVSSQSLFYQIQPEVGMKRQQISAGEIQLAKSLAEIFSASWAEDSAPLTADEIIKRMDVGIDMNGNQIKDPAAISIISLPRRIKTNLTKPEIAYIAEHRDVLPGLNITEESTRFYDSAQIATQLVGYLRPFNTAVNNLGYYKDKKDYLNEEYVGYDGLEYEYQTELRGKPGSNVYPTNVLGQIIGPPVSIPPIKGENLTLTIDKNIQLAAQEAVKNHVIQLEETPSSPTDLSSQGNQAVAGYAVAIEVNTGRVMAMVNYPDYDPNVWISGLDTAADYAKIQYSYTNGTIRERLPDFTDPEQLKKHPSSLVPPGSTLKPLTVLLGLNEGLITPTTTFQDPGYFKYGKAGVQSTVHDYELGGYGLLTAASAIAHSSNTFMAAMIGFPLYMKFADSLQIWDKYMTEFGLGVSTGSGLPSENTGIKDYMDNKNLSTEAALVQGSYGQSARYTVLQLAQYAMMLANHGIRYKPQFVDSIRTYDGQLIEKIKPVILNKVQFPDAYWQVIADGMSKVGISGFDGVSYTVARKTGTSEQQVGGKTIDNAVFIAYAPIDHPKLAVAVVVPEGGLGRYGAGPIARQIFDAYDDYIGLGDTGPKNKTAG